MMNDNEMLLREIEKLSPSQKQHYFNMISHQNRNQSYTPNHDYLNSEIIGGKKKRFDEENKFLAQKQLNRQEMIQKLDHKDCWDFYYSAVATIENIALGLSENKEYGKWDEFNSCLHKDRNQLVIQLLKILKSFKGAFLDYCEDYDSVMDYPEDMDITYQKIQKWKKIINDRNISKYADELINIVNNRELNLDIQKELDKYYKKTKYDKEEMRKGIENMMKFGKEVREEEKYYMKEFESKGTVPKYEVTLNVPAGRALKKY